MLEKTKEILTRLLLAERAPTRLAVAFCVGTFVAFSPFIGLHTLLMIIIAWFCHLNFAMIYLASHIFNNPITTIPLYWADYRVGIWFCDHILGYIPTNPVWMEWINTQLSYYTGLSGMSLWAFIIGGNLLGAAVSVMLYPLIRWMFNRLMG